MTRRKLVAGNWKSNGSLALLGSMLEATSAVDDGVVDILICPPFPYLVPALQATRRGASRIMIGAQNVGEQASGAFTGEVGAPVLADIGCGVAIIGHSERRTLFGETDDVVRAKLAQCQLHSLVSIVCVGETLAQRKSGAGVDVVLGQVEAFRDAVVDWGRVIIAYEPIWAIGTGVTASPDEAQEVHAAIRARLAMLGEGVASAARILYGGSVKPDNARILFAQPDIDGGLIGGAALSAEDFSACIRAAQDAVS